MTRDQRFWRLLTLLQDYYTTGERTVGEPPAVRLAGARPPPAGAPPAAPLTGARLASRGAPPADGAGSPDRRRALATGAANRAARPLAGAESTPPAAPALASAEQPHDVGEDSLARVAAEVAACRACGLCAGRTNTVPGEGVARPLVMVIGEGPGRDEDRSGRPFVGPAGNYLDRWLAAIELQRDAHCFIANVVKCRPPDNRDPLPAESAACLPFLQRQMRLLRPRALLSVGRVASQVLIGRPAAIGALRGEVYYYAVPGLPHALPLVTTYHPSGVLRNSSLRRAVWDDLRLLQRVLAADADPPAGAAVAEPG
jgi:DNA polymerase